MGHKTGNAWAGHNNYALASAQYKSLAGLREMSLAIWILLYAVGAVALLLLLAFLSFTGYLLYIHWKYSHIPQPKRPR